MAELDLHEQERVDALKAWWKANSNWVYGVLIVALLAFAGSQFWKQHQAGQADAAATLFEEVLKQAASGDPKRIGDAADALAERHAGSPYAVRAQLLAAQTARETGDAKRAQVRLQWVVEHADESGVQTVARLQLAALLLDEKQYDAALKQLAAPHAAAYDGLYADLKGDVLAAQGKIDEARTAYKLALEKSEMQGAQHNLTQLKLDGLGSAK